MIPRLIYFGCGTGSSPVGKMAARDLASRQVSHTVGDANIATVSSVLAPGIRVIDREDFEQLIRPGQVVKAVNGITESTEPGMVVTAAMAWVLPIDRPDLPGYVAELYGTPGIDPYRARERVEQDALQIFAQGHGDMEFNAISAWNSRHDSYPIGGVWVKVDSIVPSVIVNRSGDWTCAFVFAGMLPGEAE